MRMTSRGGRLNRTEGAELAASHQITALLRAWGHGDQGALETLVPLVEQELRAIARRALAPEQHDVLLDTNALVNEAYLRLIGSTQPNWHDRVHFYAVCAKIMRHILVDYARSRRTAKRGGGDPPVPLIEAAAVGPDAALDLVAIDEALEILTRMDERKGKVVELRFFGGLSFEETAEVLKVSTDTVQRDWRLAKAWLYRELGGAPAP
jgi:RNA polymerase sigma-70 factor, ECF subfamily